MSTTKSSGKVKKLEYRIRFDELGKVLGGSLHSYLGEQLGIPLDDAGELSIFEYVKRTAALDPKLPERLERRVRRLLDDHEEFSLHGDFHSDAKTHYLHISGRVIHNLDGDYVFTLLFLDDTQHTHLRRSYEYMFRLASHELKSPLACIIGSAECAEDHVRAGNVAGLKTCLDMIERNAWAMEEMIQRYLNLSRIESGEIVAKPSEILLSGDVLNPLMSEFETILQAKTMTLAYEFSEWDHEPHVYADAELVTIVVRNLVSNAMKYGNDGSTIRVELRAADEGVEVAVENAGPNIPDLQLRKLFQKFVRLEATQGSKGAGLGLYNARKLVELWGGSVRAESGKGKTRFVFTIPEG